MAAKTGKRSGADLGAFWRSTLGLRVLKSMVLFGAVVAVGLSTVELYLEYQAGVAVIERRLDEIEASHAEAAADRLWAVDPSGIELLAKGIASLPAVRYVEIHEINVSRQHFPTVVVGEHPRAHPLLRTIPLVLSKDGRSEVVGELHVEATLEDLYSYLVHRGWGILGEQALKSVLLASFFLFVLQRLVASRISVISSHLLAFGGVPQDAVDAGGDEIDRMQAAFTAMRASIAAKEAKLQDGERDYRSLAESSPDNIVRYDREGRIRYINRRLAAALGLKGPEEIIGRLPTEIWPGRRMDQVMEQAAARTCESGETTAFELQPAPGVIHNIVMVPERDDTGAIVGTIAFGRDISDTKRIEATLRFIADPAGTGQDGDYLPALARHLSDTLGVAYVIIDRLDEPFGFAETVALCARGNILPNMRYALAGTPCADVANSQFCLYPQGVQERFPEDHLLVEMGVHSYAGTPLLDTTGKPIGLIAVLDTAPLQNENLVTQILRIVTPRAAAELERAASDNELARREQQYRVLAESAPEYIIRYDRDHRIRYVNSRLAEFLRLSSPEEVIGRRPSEVWPDGRFDVIERAVDRAMDSGEPVPFELQAGGGLHHTLVVPERDQTGAITGTILFGRDVTELVRIESERQRLQHAVDQSADAVYVIDADGHFASVNEAACRSLGYSRDELTVRTVADIDPHFSLADVQQIIAFLTPEKPRLFETCHRTKDGRVFPVEITISLFEENGERYCIAIARDITDRKRLEEELIQQEQQFRSLAENSPDTIVRYDRQCRRLYVNPAYERLTGVPSDSVLGAAPDEAWRGSTPLADYIALLQGVMATGTAARTSLTWKSGGDEDVFLDIYVVPEAGRGNDVAGALVIGRDITRLVEAERQFHTLVENLPDNILRLDRDLRILFANGPFLARLGCGLDNALGRTLAELMGDDHPKALDEAARRAIADRRPNVTEAVFGDKISPQHILEVRHVPEFDGSGNVTSVLGVGRDISERKAHEEIEHQLMQAQKFEVLGQLAGNVAHDFNNLLGAILGFADLIVTETPADEQAHQLAARIVAAGDHGRELISKILTFARRSSLQIERVPLPLALEETKKLLAGTIPATARLVVAAPEDPGDISGDLSQIVHMLVNLCINSYHALDGGHGEITVTASRAPEESAIVHRLRRRAIDPAAAEAVETWRSPQGEACAAVGCLARDRQYRVLTVSDTGSGMDEVLLGQAFTPFFTTKEPGQGTGLGLAVVHGAVLAHGGALAVESQVGVGTRFEVYLPAANEEAPLPMIDTGGDSDRPPVLNGARILLVDDDPHFCDMLFAFLERRGGEVAPCSDPREALEAVEEFGCAWDVLVTDQTMPYLTGIELVRAVRERCPDLPCILCTGYSAESLDDEALARAGVFALLRKPLDPRSFDSVIAQALEERRSLSIG